MKDNSSVEPLIGEIRLPSDKSISHRAVLFSSVAEGDSRIRCSVLGRDNLASIRIMRQLGVDIRGTLGEDSLTLAEEEGLSGFSRSEDGVCEILISGRGFGGLKKPSSPLFCGNSGTTARLLLGLLAGRPFAADLSGDESLSARPMARVVQPLRQMGASFSGERLPLQVTGGKLSRIDYVSPRASAQVKTALLLAGLQAEGGVSVTEPSLSRDHSERMLSSMGVALIRRECGDGSWQVESAPEQGGGRLRPLEVEVPGDFSSAAFFLTAASIVPGSRLTILEVGLNPTRIGLLHLLRRMGAKIECFNERMVGGEPVGTLLVQSSSLQAISVNESEVVLSIDEIPALCVAAAFASGRTEIRGAGELRVKESDRLSMMAGLLADFGVQVEEYSDGLAIEGQADCTKWRPREANSEESSWQGCHDHRILMCAAILSYISQGVLQEGKREVIETSFPGFVSLFRRVSSASRRSE